MNPEEIKKLEDAVKAAQAAADAAHKAAGDAQGQDASLNEAAEKAEDALIEAQKKLADAKAAPAPEEEEKEPAEGEEEEEVIDFEKELEELEGGAPPAPEGEGEGKPKTELEKAKRNLHFNAERVRKLGGDPTEIVKPPKPAERPADEPAPKEGEFASRDDLAMIEAGKLARSEAERKVIMHHYKNSIKRSGDIVKDIDNAYFIANKGRIRRSIDEIRRGAAARPSPTSGAGRQRPAGEVRVPQLTSMEQQTMRRRGFKPNADGSWESKRYVMRYSTEKKMWLTTPKNK